MPSAPPVRAAFLTDSGPDILRFAAEAVQAGGKAALVTIVDIQLSAARPLGAHMAVREDGLFCGFVSGGCVESAVAVEALAAIAAGADREVRYGRGSPHWDIRLPCGGGITLAIHVLRSPAALRAALTALDARRPAGLRYDASGECLDFVAHPAGTGRHGSSFDTVYRPRARIVAQGRAVELAAILRLADASGFESRSVDAGAAAMPPIDADTAVVLLLHDLDEELPLLRAALDAAPFYIGALGSHRTHRARVDRLAALDYGEADIRRIKGPIGLFPKARDAQSLALSVLADIAHARGEASDTAG